MKNILALTIVILTNLCLSSVLLATEIILANGGVTFESPNSFIEMPKNVVRIKYPNENRPQHLYGNDDFSVSIGVKFTHNLLETSQLKSFKTEMENMLPRVIPNLKWISKKIIEINNKKWILLEMKSSAIDTDIHNIMLFTNYKGKMLAFNFNSTDEQYKKNQTILLKSILSIKIDEKASQHQF